MILHKVGLLDLLTALLPVFCLSLKRIEKCSQLSFIPSNAEQQEVGVVSRNWISLILEDAS